MISPSLIDMNRIEGGTLLEKSLTPAILNLKAKILEIIEGKYLFCKKLLFWCVLYISNRIKRLLEANDDGQNIYFINTYLFILSYIFTK